MTHSYASALEYIYGFTNYEVRQDYRYSPEVIDPFRPARLLAKLGDPQRRYPSVHVAGSKGKGSVAAICASILRAAGLRTGLYISPHLESFRERIQVDGQWIGEDELAALVDELEPLIAQVQNITTFEVMTALALTHFERRQVDVAVVEVGLGGRLDATSVVIPLVSVITTVGYDHMHLLGNTLTEIAGEKAGIIKPGVPVVSAEQAAEAMRVIEQVAAEQQAPLTVIGRDWWYEVVETDLDRQVLRAGPAGEAGRLYALPLLGEHQALNATVALAAMDVARRRWPALDEAASEHGLAQVNWPGRFQILQRSPLIVLDGAHNIDSARRLRATLESMFAGRRRLLVVGITADKAVNEIMRELLPAGDLIIVTASEHPRAMPPAELAGRLAALGYECEQAPSVAAGLARARELAVPEDVICVTGSLYVVGDALAAFYQRKLR